MTTADLLWACRELADRARAGRRRRGRGDAHACGSHDITALVGRPDRARAAHRDRRAARLNAAPGPDPITVLYPQPPHGFRPRNPEGPAANRVRLAREPPAAPRRVSSPASSTAPARRRARSRSTSATLRNVLVHGGALIDVEIEGVGGGPGGDQGAAARPGPRRAHPPRPAGGQARRRDRGRGRDRAARRRGGARGQGGRRARARHPRDHDLGPADRDPGVDPGRRLRDGDRRHASAQRPGRPRGGRVRRSARAQNADEITIATLSPPRVEEEPEPELEEEAELVGEEGEVPEGEEAPAEGEAERRRRASPATPREE